MVPAVTERPSILVIGAGIIGAAIAYHLAKGGARVTILDGAEPGGIATRHSWAWINASWGNPEPYFRLRHRAMAEWRDLAGAIPALQLDWSGGLIWDLPPDELEAYATQHAAWGYGIRRVGAAAARAIEPSLRRPPDFALHVAEEGAVDPVAAAQAMLTAAQGHGAELRRETVRALETKAGRISGIVTDRGGLGADLVVLAAGAATATLAGSAGVHVPMSAPPGLLVVTKPHDRLLKGLVMAPEMHVRQMRDGSLIAGADFGGSEPGADAAATARQVFAGLQELVTGGEALTFDHYMIGHRPLPADGFPIVGATAAAPGLYLAVTHSGVTLAPAIGRFTAAEILDNARDPLLAPYGPARFAGRAA